MFDWLHGVKIEKSHIMEKEIKKVKPQPEELIKNLFNSFGYEINLFGTNINVGYQALINVGFVVLFMILNIFSVKHITKVVADN